MATKQEIRPFFQEIYKKSDSIVEKLLFGYFLFGILLSYFYDTYTVGVLVGSLNLILYFGSKKLFPGRTVNQYMASLAAGIFMAQFIYQMHGLFEMHFTAFIAIIVLITYQNKFAFIPQLLFVVVHHSSFAYIQYLGHVNNIESYERIYFTQLDYMDFQTFLFHAGLYAVGVIIAAIYTHNLEKNTVANAENIIKLRAEESRMEANVEFAKEISEGKYDNEIQVSEDNTMGHALLEMRNSLKSSAEREQEEKFINVGLAEIGELMRNNNENIENLSNKLISYLVKYMNYNQGGIFIVQGEGDDKYLELMGTYAYDRQKFVSKRIDIGQGLLGQCYLEKEPIYLKEVPKDYINITSGLGDAPPSFLLMIPIKSEDSIQGVIELASFHEIDTYEIEFLKRVCENLAGVIYSTQINQTTKELYEQSQQQAEEMRAQEEEMRQNMEELSATQEEMERKTAEFESRFAAIEQSGLLSVEFNIDGHVLDANTTFLDVTGYNKETLLGEHYKNLVNDNESNLWGKLKNGKNYNGEFDVKKRNGKELHLNGSFSVIRDSNGNPEKVLAFAVDITSYK